MMGLAGTRKVHVTCTVGCGRRFYVAESRLGMQAVLGSNAEFCCKGCAVRRRRGELEPPPAPLQEHAPNMPRPPLPQRLTQSQGQELLQKRHNVPQQQHAAATVVPPVPDIIQAASTSHAPVTTLPREQQPRQPQQQHRPHQQHVQKRRERPGAGGPETSEVVLLIECPICAADLASLSARERYLHFQKCEDTTPAHSTDTSSSASSSTAPPTAAAAAAAAGAPTHAPELVRGCTGRHICIICGRSLVDCSTRMRRLEHVKQCFRKSGMHWRAYIHREDAAAAVGHNDKTKEGDDGEGETSGSTATSVAAAAAEVATTAAIAAAAATVTAEYAPTSALDMLMSAARAKATNDQIAKRAKLAGSKSSGNRWAGRRKGGQRKEQQAAGRPRKAPAFKLVRGGCQFPIVVDGFQFASPTLSPVYFLTHFHSDHYVGLTRGFDCGTIYCERITANLVAKRLKVPAQRMRVLPVNERVEIPVGTSRVFVTLIPANHCPGAIMPFFEMPSGRRVLHTGDFRWDRELMLRNPILRGIAEEPDTVERGALTVFLDTTYCDPKYTFPTQSVIIAELIRALREEIDREPTGLQDTLVAVGAYSVGKERVYMEIARALGEQVSVDNDRFHTICCYGWGVDQMELITPVATERTHLRVVPMGHINFKHLWRYRARKAPHMPYGRVIGISPTGWSHTSQRSRSTSIVQRRAKGHDLVILSVAYSEHSSFDELRDCMRALRPTEVIPTVNTTEEKVREQLALLNV